MRVIVSGGGTGGHIYPAISLIEEMKSRDQEISILYVGTPDGLESRLIPERGIPYRSIHVKGLPRKISLKLISASIELLKGLRMSGKIIKAYKPDLVIGTGGFVSGPILYMATRKKIPTLVHEQNSYPGIANRILSRFVDRVCITFEASRNYFNKPDRIVLTGNPIRGDFRSEGTKEDYDVLGLDPNKPVVFSFGGSNGSQDLNEAMAGCVSRLIQQGIQVIHATGPLHYDGFVQSLEGLSDAGLKVFSYVSDMARCYAVADLIVTSSGAISLAEISQVGLPSILIPKAYTTENHQEYNAKVYVDNGASEMILEKDLNASLLYDTIVNIIGDAGLLKKMGCKSRELGFPKARQMIIDEAFSLVKR